MIGFEDPMGVRTFVITFEPFSQFQKFIPHFKALFNAHQMRRLEKGADGYLGSRWLVMNSIKILYLEVSDLKNKNEMMEMDWFLSGIITSHLSWFSCSQLLSLNGNHLSV